jgi:hypothetical protein
MDTSVDLDALQPARDLVEARGDVYWQAGQDGTMASIAELNGETVETARARWLAIAESATNPDHAAAFGRAANEFLNANEAVGRAEAAAERAGRTYETGVEVGEARRRRHVATGELLKRARPVPSRIGEASGVLPGPAWL